MLLLQSVFNYIGDCISQDVAVGLGKGLMPSFCSSAVQETN